MCGIAGFLRPGGFDSPSCTDVAKRLTLSLAHRGPDDSGVWIDAEAGIALGHTRLAVLNLSRAGYQPMVSASGRFVVVYNGEIYNHAAVRSKLEHSRSSAAWRGHSDTETLLAAIEAWGVDRALREFTGMFSFALWDRQERELVLARDRLGEKPLYYGWQRGFLLFSAEIKAIREHPAFEDKIDRSALAGYIRYGYIRAPHSIYRDIFKLIPGSYLRIAATSAHGAHFEPRIYWSMRDEGGVHSEDRTDTELIEQLEEELSRSISTQKLADVPVGAFLSGGIDSTAIVALLQAQASKPPVKTFTIGFDEPGYNEATHAKSIAGFLKTDHTELYVSPREAMNVVPRLPMIYDEPFGDSSAIPTFLVSELARSQVTVSLSGDGGDELFGGYRRYHRTMAIWKASRRIPEVARSGLSAGLRAIGRLRPQNDMAAGGRRLASYLAALDVAEVYDIQSSLRQDEHELVLGLDREQQMPALPTSFVEGTDSYGAMMHTDAHSYLPDDILVKVDRAAMAVSLETRMPMLDHRVVKFAFGLPLRAKIRDGQSKWLLKAVLRRHVPDSLTDRPKMGFGVPVGQWVRGPLRDWAEDLVTESRLKRDGFLQPSRIREEWLRHLQGTGTGGDGLWAILMFQSWLATRAESSA